MDAIKKEIETLMRSLQAALMEEVEDHFVEMSEKPEAQLKTLVDYNLQNHHSMLKQLLMSHQYRLLL